MTTTTARQTRVDASREPGAPAPGAQLRGSLLRRYVVYLVALVTTALLVSGLVGLYFTYNESKEARLGLQREKAEAAATRIESYIAEIESQLGWVRLSLVGSTAPEQRRIEYMSLLRQVPAITEVAMLDHTGRERLRLARVGVDVVNSLADLSRTPAFTVARNGTTYVSPVYFRKESEPYMTLAVSGIGDNADITVAEVSLKHVVDIVSRIEVGRQGLAYVVDARGHLIAHPDLTQVLRKADLSALPHVRAALSTEDEGPAMMAKGIGGREALIAHASIQPLGWHVLVEQPLQEALGPLYASLQRTGVLLLAGFLLAIAFSVALARHMVTPIRAIQAGAARIAVGDLDQRIAVASGDELQALAEEFNDMARLLRESYTSLERKVHERTLELRSALDQQTATADVLRVVSSSPTEIQPVLDAVVEKAANVCSADDVVVRLTDGSLSRVAAHIGTLPVSDALRVSPRSISGRAVVERATIQVADVTSARDRAEFPESAVYGFRSVVAVPLVSEGRADGVIVMRRREDRPFTDGEVKLLETFAAQAAIALRNTQLFQEIARKSREVELANLHKSKFLANVSHELRTPLNAIIGFSEVLQARMFGELNAKQSEYIDDIYTSGTHLLSLINDILNLAKVEAGRMDLELSRFDVHAAVHGALGVVRERASRQGISLVLEPGEGVGEWVADERKFKQIMLNLLSNAVKFTRDGGRIAVRTERTSSGLQISVSDTGVGIPPQHLETIFDEFRQLAADNPRTEEGTGLGLPLTRRLLELHGGTISVQSEIGVGSIFRFTLPEHTLQAAA